jgi:hypothetical protein
MRGPSRSHSEDRKNAWVQSPSSRCRSPGADTQIIGGTLKLVYEDFVAEQTNNKFPLKDQFKWVDVDFAGSEVVYDAHVTRNISPMFCGEDGAFADAGAQQSIKVHIGQRKLMARVRLTSEAIHDSMKSEGAFQGGGAKTKWRGSSTTSRAPKNTRSRATAAACFASSTATPTRARRSPSIQPGGIAGADFGNRFILPGMYVGAVDPATGSLRRASARWSAARRRHVDHPRCSVHRVGG